ncbi:MAG: hypothetical protein WC802_01870 [Patescibacteria group bacterium]|jgi:hypothetical protein
MPHEPLGFLLVLALLWFVSFWILGGVIFAIIGLVRFLRLNKNRFSCLFTILSALTGFGAAWMGLLAARANDAEGCLDNSTTFTGITQFFPNLFSCSSQEVLYSAGLWFLFLMAAGIVLLFFSRAPERPRDMHGND